MELKKQLKKHIKSIVLILLVSWIISKVILNFIIPITVIGISMYPTLEDGYHLLAYTKDKPTYLDIIVFRNNGEYLSKRVIGAPGDTILLQDGEVYRNGEQLHEPYLNTKEPGTFGNMNIVVPEGKLFVLGDNRNHSLDSRYIGMINESDIVGKVFFSVIPFKKVR